MTPRMNPAQIAHAMRARDAADAALKAAAPVAPAADPVPEPEAAPALHNGHVIAWLLASDDTTRARYWRGMDDEPRGEFPPALRRACLCNGPRPGQHEGNTRPPTPPR